MQLNYADKISYAVMCWLRGSEGMFANPLRKGGLDVSRERREDCNYELIVTDFDGQKYRVAVERMEPEGSAVIAGLEEAVDYAKRDVSGVGFPCERPPLTVLSGGKQLEEEGVA